jgi:pimeloyl-ACP methyl ester carboxylesterase
MGAMPSIEVNDVKLEVQRLAAGDGRRLAPIVFLHEGLGSVAMWREWPAEVCAATGRDGVVYSRRGYGQSESIADVRGVGRLGPDYMHREASNVLPGLLAALGIDRPVLLGHSDGGSIALLYASRFPVTACVVMAPHILVEEISVTSIEAARSAYEGGELRERLSRYHSDVDSAFWQWNDVWLSQSFRSFDIRDHCHRIEAPVLAIQGTDDPYGTQRQIDEIAPTRGPFKRILLQDCGHSPQRDQPAVTLGHVTDFLMPLA